MVWAQNQIPESSLVLDEVVADLQAGEARQTSEAGGDDGGACGRASPVDPYESKADPTSPSPQKGEPSEKRFLEGF